MPRCPTGHASDAADFCSVCGAEIGGPAAAGEVVACPVCTAPLGSPPPLVCPVCGFDRRAAAAVVRLPSASPAEVRWDVEVRVDPSLHRDPDPLPPEGTPPQTFTLFDAEAVVGRAGSGVRVQVPVAHDPAVSKRHAAFARGADGTLTVRDLGSANGTRLNGVELTAGVDHPVKDGDAVAVGAWTRITVRRVR